MRKRMSWDWVGKYPVFIYTTWIDHNQFNVDIVIGKKGDQNAPGYGPDAKPDHSYKQIGMASKNEVTKRAFVLAKHIVLPAILHRRKQ